MTALPTAQRICILLAKYSNSGVPRNRLTLAAGFAAEGFDVDLIVIGGSLPRFEREGLPSTVRVIELHRSRVLEALPYLVKYLKDSRIAALVSAEEHLNVVTIVSALLARVSLPISVSFHVPPERGAAKPLWRKARWNSLLGHWLYPRATAIVAVSSGLADTLSSSTRLARSSVTVIYNPVVHPALFKKAVEPIVSECSFDPGFILSVGRLSPNKGYADLIDAFSLMRDKTNLNLVIVGDGKEKERLKAKVDALGLQGRVFLPGAVNNPYAWMNKAKLFVLASHFEGLSNVLVEAMACGCPVVSTDCPTGPREILQDGCHGPLVPLEDPVALSAAMLATLEAPTDAEQLRARAMDFHVNLIVRQYLSALGLRLATRGPTAPAEVQQ